MKLRIGPDLSASEKFSWGFIIDTSFRNTNGARLFAMFDYI
jgi:hypothetical protein